MKRKQNLHILTPEKILFPPTYMKSTSRTTFEIINKDSEHFRFEWRFYSSESEESKIISKSDILEPDGRQSSTTGLLFHSTIFSISPMSGDIWGNSSLQSIASFHPDSPVSETVTAYLVNLDTGDRLPFLLEGQGLPPSATFNVQQVNIGHVALDGVFEYKIYLQNTGLIPLDFHLIERVLSFPKISFSPKSGTLQAGETVPIHFVLEANHVGQFNETYMYEISDLEDWGCPTITIFGRIIGPTFNISRQSLEFGTVSYGFLYCEEFEVENTSEIPFDFMFQFEKSATYSDREFCIIPQKGTIPKFSKQTVRVEFIPTSIQKYSLSLIFASEKFSEQLMSIPITADCVCPEVQVVSSKIDLGQIYLNYEYHFNIVIKNDSEFPAKFEYVECQDESILYAHIKPLKCIGEAQPKSECIFPFSIEPIQLGHIDFTRYLKVAGSDESPLRFDVTCMVIGPIIEMSTEKIEFGQIEMLTQESYEFQIKNNSLIPAYFEVDFDNKMGVFSLYYTTADIEPGQTINFTVFAYLDDNIDFRGKITFNFQHLEPIILNIHAKGKGKSLVSSYDISEIDMKCHFTGVPIYEKFEISNICRRVQEIKWNSIKPEVEHKNGVDPEFHFKIEPESCSIHPKEIIEVTMSFFSKYPCTFIIQPVCEATVGKKKYDMFKPMIKGEFIKPSIELDCYSHSYTYVHDSKKEEELTGGFDSKVMISPSKELLTPLVFLNSIRNISKLPLAIRTKVTPPFSISPDCFNLDPDSCSSFKMIFDPSFKKDFTSQKVDGKIVFSFEDNNPQHYSIDLHANLIFPNLSLSPQSIWFGNLLKSTEHNKTVQISNISEVPVSFFWELLPKNKDVDISKLFDIYPIRGEVEVGGSQEIHITFFALDHNNDEDVKYDGYAVCHVIGGPDYTVDLTGSSASVEYQLGPKNIDFGTRYFAENLHSTVSLTNSSDIPLTYEIKLPKKLSMAFVSVEPKKGSLKTGETQIFHLWVIPGFPSKIKDCFWIRIGQFVDEEITFNVDGAFPQIESTFKRSEDDEPTRIMQTLNHENKKSFIQIENQIMVNRLKEISNSSSFLNHLNKMAMTNFDKITNFDEFILSKFEVNFGHMTLGEIKSFNYKVKSVSRYPISFEFLTKSLKETGFSIEPTSFEDIPANTEIEITVKFDDISRTKKNIGDEIYKVPILFSEDLASLITIKSTISMPVLEFSADHFDFETTLVGQKRTMTLQVINRNLITLEFQIEDLINQSEIGSSSTKPNKSKNRNKSAFIAYPRSGVLPPISYQNIEITFEPNNNRDYLMAFPIKITHSLENKYIYLNGKGVELKLKINPNNFSFSPLKPFDESFTFDAEISNPNEFPIEVLLPQWDLEIENEILSRKFKESQPSDSEESSQENTIVTTMNSVITDPIKTFSLCIIVNGPSKSGKTTVSRYISKLLDDIPIVQLSEVWKDLIENDVTEPNDYITAFSNYISGNDFLKGFVIDGLNCLPDQPDLDSLLLVQMKQKHVAESLNKNPFLETPGDLKISLETALNYILDGLNGQYVFQIALQATPDAIDKHQQFIENEENKQKEDKGNEEFEKLMNMGEDDYLKLSEEDQKSIDQKRVEYRKKILQEQGIDLNALFENLNLNNDNNGSNANSRLKNRKRSQLSSRRFSSLNKNLLAQKKAQQHKNAQIALEQTNSNKLSILTFTYSLGKISKKIENTNDTFQSIDLVIMADKTSEGCLRQNHNTILIDSLKEIEEIQQQIKDFLPNLNEIIEKVLPKFISEPVLFIPKYCSQESNHEHLPCIKQFKILNKERPGEFPIFEKASPNSSKISNSRLAKRKSIKSTIDKTLTQNLDVMNYTKRYNLDIGQSEKVTIMYSSEEIGSFDQSIIFSIDDVSPNQYNLCVSGQCMYPDVERSPEKVFNKVVNKLTNRTEFAYVNELNEFHFGALLVAKERTKNQPYQYRQPMKFFNSSPFEVQISAFLAKNPSSHIWKIEESPATIQPGESKEIFICFHPVVPEIFNNTVKLFIKDNPEPFSFNIVAESCSPTLELSTTTLEFDKLLLKQSKKLEIELQNPNRIQSIWKINKPNQFNGLFNFNETEGVVPPRGTKKLEISYSSNKPQVVKKQMQIDVLDSTKQKTYQSYKIQLNAESFDVNFDFFYPKGMDHLIIGTVKANQAKSLVCTLKNKGKYSSEFKFSFAKPCYSSSVTIEPMSGTLLPADKPLSIEFTFCSKKVVHLDQETICYLTVSDSMSNVKIAKVGVTMSVDSLYSQYKMEPTDVIEFGSLIVGKSLRKELSISNIGSFPFDYELIPKIKIIEPKNSNDSSKRPRRNTVKQPPTGARSKKGKLLVGCFSISHSEGTIQPGGKETIIIDFSSQTAQQCKNVFFLKISDVPAKDPAFKGIEYHFNGEIFAPGIEINQFKQIFPQQNICLRYDILTNNVTSFLEDEQIFHFKPELIGEKKSVDIVISNIYPVNCTVDLSVKQSFTRRRSISSFPFKLSTDMVELPPLSNKTIQLLFMPTVVGNYTGCFKAEVRGPSDPNSKVLKFEVEGIAALPEISVLNYDLVVVKPPGKSPSISKMQETTTKSKNLLTKQSSSSNQQALFKNSLIKPINNNSTNSKLGKNQISRQMTPSVSSRQIAPPKFGDRDPSPLNSSSSSRTIVPPKREVQVSFGKTLINSNKIKHVVLKNTGVLPAKIQVSDMYSKEFSIENVDCSKEFEILPDKTFDIAVLFAPLAAHVFETKISVKLVNNPAMDIMLNFIGEGSDEDIIFEGIPGDDNHLKFKDACISRNQIVTFTMKNVSESDYRFAWIENNNFHFCPRIGHLHKKQSKLVKINFFSDKPISYESLKVNCQLVKIELQDKDSPDWDDSMTIVKYVQRMSLPPADIPPSQLEEKPRNGRRTTFKRSSLRRSSSIRRTKLQHKETSTLLTQAQSKVEEIAGDLVKVIEVKNEPLYEQLPYKCPDVCISLSAVADVIKYELSESKISFSPTMMFETRVVEVTLTNTCNIRFDYGWRATQFTSHQGNYSKTHKNPFSVLPKTGFIEAGKKTVFKVCFTPEEVDDFSSILQCEIPYLSSIDPPRIEVNGFSRRPLCHFSVVLSDYLTAGRRLPDFTFPLPDDIRVLELFASGIGKKTWKKFEIVNTTSHPYEIVWNKSKDYNNDAVTCDTMRSFISSGTSYPVSFSYLPKTVKSVESMWIFTIPEHQIEIPFLIVGRIMSK